MNELKTKIGLIDITDKDEEKFLQQTVDLLNKNDKDIKKLMKVFEKQPAQVRSFLTETFFHIVLASGKLSPTVTITILEKMKALQIGIVSYKNEPIKPADKLVSGYVG